MKLRAPCLVSAAAVATMLAAVAVARAETWTLELKRLESAGSLLGLRLYLSGDLCRRLLRPDGPQGKTARRWGIKGRRPPSSGS